MTPATAEWVAKAEGDWHTAVREAAAVSSPYPNPDAVCFHSHQCLEKYLKSILVEQGAAFPKTHDLSALLSLAQPFSPGLAVYRDDLDRLAALGVEIRYPGSTADPEDAREALETAAVVRRSVRNWLGLDSESRSV